MIAPVSLMDDQMVDMAFITQLTGLTDKWFYKLIKDGDFPGAHQNGPQLPMAEKRSGSPRCRRVLHSPVRKFLTVHLQTGVLGLPAAFLLPVIPREEYEDEATVSDPLRAVDQSYQNKPG